MVVFHIIKADENVLSNSCKAFLAYSSIHVESLLIHWLHMFDCNLACVYFVSSSTGGYAIALVELIKLAFSVLNRLLARKEKVCLFRIMLLKCPPILLITFLQQFKRL